MPVIDEEEGKWGMAIDLDRCTGCQACVTACMMENNIPFVGEKDAGYGRSMFWMRIERLWTDEWPETMAEFRPIMCQQCGAAPCEPVCPVFASAHSEAEQVNMQIYNRCIGTRFCGNNCPYIARLFNWFDYSRNMPEPLNYQFNPDVTVRGRGVMEKCTFCIQRIRRVEEDAKAAGKAIRDGDVVPACAQACPTDAIVFGLMADESSRINQLVRSARAEQLLLEELGTKPRVAYLKGERAAKAEGKGENE